MHDRDEAGWKSTFKAPFHKEIPMTELERDTFASYSALNMPLISRTCRRSCGSDAGVQEE